MVSESTSSSLLVLILKFTVTVTRQQATGVFLGGQMPDIKRRGISISSSSRVCPDTWSVL